MQKRRKRCSVNRKVIVTYAGIACRKRIFK
jgi:hypothetical protein